MGKLISQLSADEVSGLLANISVKIIRGFFELFRHEMQYTSLTGNGIDLHRFHFYNGPFYNGPFYNAPFYNNGVHPQVFAVVMTGITVLPDKKREKQKNQLIMFFFKFFKTYWRFFWEFAATFTGGLLDNNFDLPNHPMTEAYLNPGIFNQGFSTRDFPLTPGQPGMYFQGLEAPILFPPELEALKMELQPQIALMKRQWHPHLMESESAEVKLALEEIIEDMVVDMEDQGEDDQGKDDQGKDDQGKDDQGKDQDRIKIILTLKTCNSLLFDNGKVISSLEAPLSTWKKATLDAAENIKEGYFAVHKTDKSMKKNDIIQRLHSDEIFFHFDETDRELIIVIDTPSTTDECEEIRKNKVFAGFFFTFIKDYHGLKHFRFNGLSAYTVDAVRGKTKTSKICAACIQFKKLWPGHANIYQEHEGGLLGGDLPVDSTTADQIRVHLTRLEEQYYSFMLDVVYGSLEKERGKQCFLKTIDMD